ncbi:MAG TPA: preprotein translocase subunit SecG [Rhodospirillaceae bacterium]|nr:preprotein translocase subunit SecG [Rhodospirillaceae bacterium]
MDNVLIIIHLLIAVSLVVCVLLQRTAQDGGGLMGGGGGGGTMGGLFTARGSANLLTRTTSILAVLFMVMSLLLGIVASRTHRGDSITEQIDPLMPSSGIQVPGEAPEPIEDAVPVVPVPKK